MNQHTPLRTVLAAATLAGAATVALAAPASAARVADGDPADATGSLNDVRGVVVVHGTDRVRVQVRVADLRPASDGGPASLSVFLDTDGSRRGPELRVATGLQEGTDYQLVRMQDWHATGDPLACGHHVALDFADDVVRVRASRGCLGTPERVRVAVRMRDDWDASHPITDWVDGRRSFTSWVASD